MVSLSVAAGALTLALFTSNYPAGFTAVPRPAVTEPAVPRSREFKAIVIHGPVSPCAASRPGSRDVQAHFIVKFDAASGTAEAEATPRWKDQLPAAHLKDPDLAAKSIAIRMEAPAHPAQGEVLADLVRRLRAEFGIAADRIYAHSALERGSSCRR